MLDDRERLLRQAVKFAQQRVATHIERFAAAYIKACDIPPEECVMHYKINSDGVVDIWFTRKGEQTNEPVRQECGSGGSNETNLG